MAKPKLTDLKRYLGEMTEPELRAELLQLFSKLTQVQDFYAQELMSPTERKAVLEQYKKKIYGQFYTRSGNPRDPSNAELRKLLTEFQKVSVVPAELAELLLYRVEVTIDFADEFGGMSDGSYSAASNAFEKAVKWIVQHKLETYFQIECRELAYTRKENFDHYFKDDLQDIYNQHFG